MNRDAGLSPIHPRECRRRTGMRMRCAINNSFPGSPIPVPASPWRDGVPLALRGGSPSSSSGFLSAGRRPSVPFLDPSAHNQPSHFHLVPENCSRRRAWTLQHASTYSAMRPGLTRPAQAIYHYRDATPPSRRPLVLLVIMLARGDSPVPGCHFTVHPAQALAGGLLAV